MSSSTQAYKEIIEKRIKEINRQISSLSSTNHHIFRPDEIEVKIRGLKNELEILREELDNLDNRARLSDAAEDLLASLDEKSIEAGEEIEKLQKTIDSLKKIRDDLKTNRVKKLTTKILINNKEKKVKKLKNAQTMIVGAQRKIMFPKYRRDLKRLNLLSKAEKRVEYYHDKIDDNETILEHLREKRESEGLTIREQFEEIRFGIFNYFDKRRLRRSQEILDDMNSRESVIMMRGARPISLGKRIVKNLRDRFNNTFNNSNTNTNGGPAPVM